MNNLLFPLREIIWLAINRHRIRKILFNLVYMVYVPSQQNTIETMTIIKQQLDEMTLPPYYDI